MICPLCQRRKAKRACPALGRQICSTCCGTKRLKEIACPADCIYLASARAHPAAVVQRQRDRDIQLLLEMSEGLSALQMGFFGLLHNQVLAYLPTAVPALVDADVEHAAQAMASTLETAARGILYEHQASSLPAQRLLSLFRRLEAEVEERGVVPPGVLAVVFRRWEAAARVAAAAVGRSDTAFVDFLARLRETAPPRDEGSSSPDVGDAGPEGPRIILA